MWCSYITNATLHPPFNECDGSDDGFVQTLRCGDTFHLFRFYHGRPYLNGSFDRCDRCRLRVYELIVRGKVSVLTLVFMSVVLGRDLMSP
eukprot:COSAG02_NODE_147_length_33939_cov_6.689539_24_plen_90_part_00